MNNGKIFPSKLRKIVMIIGGILLLIILIMSGFNFIGSNVTLVSLAIVTIVFAFLLPILIKRYERKLLNKQKLNPL